MWRTLWFRNLRVAQPSEPVHACATGVDAVRGAGDRGRALRARDHPLFRGRIFRCDRWFPSPAAGRIDSSGGVLRSHSRQDSAERHLHCAGRGRSDSVVDGGAGIRPGHCDSGDGGVRSAIYFRTEIPAVGVGEDQHVPADSGGAGGDGCARRDADAGGSGVVVDGGGDGVERRALHMEGDAGFEERGGVRGCCRSFG